MQLPHPPPWVRPVFARSKGAYQKDLAARQAPAQVEEQVDRSVVGPLQVVQKQQQRAAGGDLPEHLGDFFQNLVLLQARGPAETALRARRWSNQPAGPLR